MIRNIYRRIFPDYVRELEQEVKGCKSLLDVGCGAHSPIKRFSKGLRCVGVDAHKPSIQASKKEGIHEKYYNIDALAIGKHLKKNSFDCVLASDLIEHVTKKEGLKLISEMERIAKKKVIIFTPSGFMPQAGTEDNPWQEHKSGWIPKEMKKKGYRIIGINGWKPFRGENAGVKWWPKFFWIIVSDLTQLFTRSRPDIAFQMLCIKDMRTKK